MGIKRVGIDVGGTKVNIGLIDDEKIVDKSRFNCNYGENFSLEEFVDKIADTFFELLKRNSTDLGEIKNIGIGVPGTADTKTGNVVFAPNILGRNVPLGKMIEEKIGKKTLLCQDSSAAAWGEHLFGAGRDWDDFICITLGTGIGGGIVLSGKVHKGITNSAGELGHLCVEREGNLCGCGKKGCMEAYASGTGIYKASLKEMPDVFEGTDKKAEETFRLAREGDERALKIIHEAVDRLAFGLSMAVNVVGVDKIIVSGGMCSQKDFMIDPLPELMKKYGLPSWTEQDTICIKQAELGGDSPMVGAAFYDLAI